jgi:hypothetical protein
VHEYLYRRSELVDPCRWTAPEHVHTARTMQRTKRGILIIELNPIFAYSRRNPPEFLIEAVRLKRKQA